MGHSLRRTPSRYLPNASSTAKSHQDLFVLQQVCIRRKRNLASAHEANHGGGRQQKRHCHPHGAAQPLTLGLYREELPRNELLLLSPREGDNILGQIIALLLR